MSEQAYLGPWKISMMKLFVKIVNGFQLFKIFGRSTINEVCQGPKYAWGFLFLNNMLSWYCFYPCTKSYQFWHIVSFECLLLLFTFTDTSKSLQSKRALLCNVFVGEKRLVLNIKQGKMLILKMESSCL